MESSKDQRAGRATRQLKRAWLLLVAVILSMGGAGCSCDRGGQTDVLSQPLTATEGFLQALRSIQQDGPILRGRLSQAKGKLSQIRNALKVPKQVAAGLKGFEQDLELALRLSKTLRAIPAIRTPIDKLRTTVRKLKDSVHNTHRKVKSADDRYIAPLRAGLKGLESALQRGHDQLVNIERIAKDNEFAFGYLQTQTNCTTLLDEYARVSRPVAEAVANAITTANTTINELESTLSSHLDLTNSVWGDAIGFSRAFLNVAGDFNISLGAGLSLRGLLGKLRGIDSILRKKIDFGLFSLSIQDALDAASWIVDQAKGLLKPVLQPIEDLIKIPSIQFPGISQLTSKLNSWSPASSWQELGAAFKKLTLPDFAALFSLSADIASVYVSEFCDSPDLAGFQLLPASLQSKFTVSGGQVAPCPDGKLCQAGSVVPCPVGSYCNEGAQGKCADLKPTHYCDGAIRKPCPPGYQCVQGVRRSCPDSYTYKATSITTVTTRWIYCENGVPNDCFELSDGLHYCAIVSGASPKSYKAPCPKGTRCYWGQSHKCESGYGCGWTAKLKCDELGPFLYCDGMALTPCPKGAICDKGAITGHCSQLKSGEYCTYRTPTNSDIPHAVARKEIGTVAVRTPCPEGTSYCDKGVRYDCPDAASGQYCEGGQRRNCSDLPAGFRCDVIDGRNHKVACKGDDLTGLAYCEGGQQHACAALDAMHYCAGDDADGYQRLLCPKGWQCSAGQKLACPSGHKCEQGTPTPCPTSEPCNFVTQEPTYYEEDGQKKPCNALAGTHACSRDGCEGGCGITQAGINRRKIPCPQGSYCAFGLIQGACHTLDHRYYCDQTRLAACPPEHYCQQGQAYDCRQLSSGEYCEGSEKKSCPRSRYKCEQGIKTPCPDGSYCLSGRVYPCSNLRGMLTCMEGTYGSCPSGHSCIEGVAYKCSELSSEYYCKLHTYGSDGYKQHGYRQRVPCPHGHYCEGGVKNLCSSLPNSHYCNGHQKQACPDYYICVNGERRTCPAGKVCKDGVALPCPAGQKCSSGVAFSCPSGQFCVDGKAYPNGTSLNGPLSGLYVNLEQRLYHINTETGVWTQRGNGTWLNARGMATYNNKLYIVQSDRLYQVDPASGAYTKVGTATWPTTSFMTSIEQHLYLVSRGYLYQIDASTSQGNSTRLTSGASWTGTNAMASHAGNLYIVQGGSIDSLYQAHTNGTWTRKGPSGVWDQTHPAMAAIGDSLYIVQKGNLYKVNPNNGSWVNLNPGCPGLWSNARVAFAKSGQLYIMTAVSYPRSIGDYQYEHYIYRVSTSPQCSRTNLSIKYTNGYYGSHGNISYRGVAIH